MNMSCLAWTRPSQEPRPRSHKVLAKPFLLIRLRGVPKPLYGPSARLIMWAKPSSCRFLFLTLLTYGDHLHLLRPPMETTCGDHPWRPPTETTHGKGDREIARVWGWGGVIGNAVPWVWQCRPVIMNTQQLCHLTELESKKGESLEEGRSP